MKPMKAISGIEFGKERVPVDGRHFAHCHFTNTKLVFKGRERFIFEDCTGTFDLVCEGAARVVLDQLAALHACGFADLVEKFFAMVRNPFQNASVQ